MRAAGLRLTSTVADPLMMVAGGPTHCEMSDTMACGISPVITFGEQGPIMGPPTWGIGGVPGVTIGHIVMSLKRAAGCPNFQTPALVDGNQP